MRIKSKKLSDISWRDIRNYFTTARYLRTREVTNYLDLPKKIFIETEPVFVLSTGRCGTELLVKLFRITKAGMILHEPRPRIFLASKMAYEMNEEQLYTKKMAFLGARYDLLKDAYLREKRYIETSNRMTFFADAIYNLFPKSKFIHLVRDPRSFVRSGIRRNYYTGNENDDGRLVPNESDPIYNQWNNFSQIRKIGWLWNETNRYIEELKLSFNPNRVLTIKAEDLFQMSSTFLLICSFLDLKPPSEKRINTIISKPMNRQYKGFFPKFDDWSDEQKAELNAVANLIKLYGYSL